MLGLILLYFIGKFYYELAKKFNLNCWGYAILGIVAYYVGTFLGGIILAIGYELFSSTSIEDIDDTALGILAVPFGMLASWGLYKILKQRNIQKFEGTVGDSEILDDQMF